MPFDYPDAIGPKTRPGVAREVRRYRLLPMAAKRQLPNLLFWLLGSSTPPFKESKQDACYGASQAIWVDPKDGLEKPQLCGNCRFAWLNYTDRNVVICSQVSGRIEPVAWCRRWVMPKPRLVSRN